MAYNNPMMRAGQPPLDSMTGLPVEDITMVPPRYSPVAGGFTEKTQQEVQNMTGTPEMRQYGAAGMSAPLFMKGTPLHGNAFSAALQAAKNSGQEMFTVGDKTYNVK